MLSNINWGPDTIFAAGLFAVPIVAIVAGVWYKIAKVQSDNELKRTMVERGMSVDEMERVLAGRSSDAKM